ncbi:Uncharacterized protein TCM_044483 [Theobroma cacao]|uniref:Uncharacterized protein n=1 Tax=Theobroma cacao TaxID=3641 RepID=A0A061FPZ5_THECC|nr:Uncharacterized protein TCM_044483 [Theobroma cacao]
MQPLLKNATSLLPFANDTMMVVSDDNAFDQMDYDCAKDDTTDWNDDNYVGRHYDCLNEDKGDDNSIPNCNHVDGSTKHATIVVLEDVQYDDATTVGLEDV